MFCEIGPVIITAEEGFNDEGYFADLGLIRISHGLPIDHKDPGM